jgi:hypothetical protein
MFMVSLYNLATLPEVVVPRRSDSYLTADFPRYGLDVVSITTLAWLPALHWPGTGSRTRTSHHANAAIGSECILA